MNKTDVIEQIINIEGGYVNDSQDSGGETNYGLTKRTAVSLGFEGQMKDMTYSQAVELYKLYFQPLKLEDIFRISPKLARVIPNPATLCGFKSPIKWLQRSLNILNNKGKYYPDIMVDGLIGRDTLRALEVYINFRGFEGEEVLIEMIKVLFGNYLIELTEKREKDEKYIYGWFKNRINDCQAHQ